MHCLWSFGIRFVLQYFWGVYIVVTIATRHSVVASVTYM